MESITRLGYIYGLYCDCHTGAGIRYVGQTVQEVPRRLYGHFRDSQKSKTPVSNWIRKHGKESIRYVVIEVVKENALDGREVFWIKRHRTMGSSLLNLLDGGGGSRGRVLTDETKMRISHSLRGRKMPRESVEKSRLAKMGQLVGYKHSDASRKNMSEAYWRSFENGNSSPNRLGSKHSEESIKKMSISHKGLSSGEKHPMAKLNDSKVRQIRSRIDDGERLVEISRDFGVTLTCISSIKHNRSWRHVV